MPQGNPASAFRDGAFFIEGKDGTLLACDPALHSYAELFSARYKTTAHIYDLSLSGAKTGLPFLSEEDAATLINREANRTQDKLTDSGGAGVTEQTAARTAQSAAHRTSAVHSFYAEEKKRLHTLRSALTGETPLNTEDLKALLEECSYLYIHFPDGHRGASLSQSFLNRVRSEIDGFIKDMETAETAAAFFP